jgi:8-oxo-dGTP pyrophosphatase MutT (NUDIX family)
MADWSACLADCPRNRNRSEEIKRDKRLGWYRSPNIWTLLSKSRIGAKLKAPASIEPISQFAQVAALPLMVGDDGIERVLLLTSRETGRWVIPKGWPIRGRKPHEAAAQEALEEAGVTGQVKKKPIGSYRYFKRREAHFDVCEVDVYLLRVERQLKNWREKGQREAQWFTLDEAADLVQEPGLVALLRDLARIGLGAEETTRSQKTR